TRAAVNESLPSGHHRQTAPRGRMRAKRSARGHARCRRLPVAAARVARPTMGRNLRPSESSGVSVQVRFFHLLVCVGALGCAGDGDGEVGPEDATPAALRSQPHPTPPQSFTAFERGQVRPLAFSADRQLLYATNTPDNRVEI